MKVEFIENDGGRSKHYGKKKVSDCVIRAFTIATGRPYKEVLAELFDLGKEMGNLPNSKPVYREWLKRNGWVEKRFPKGTRIDDECVRGESNKGWIICHTGGHLMAMFDECVNDTFDSRTNSNNMPALIYRIYTKQ